MTFRLSDEKNGSGIHSSIPSTTLVKMNINSSVQRGSSSSPGGSIGSRAPLAGDTPANASLENAKRTASQSRVDRYAKNASDLSQIKSQVNNTGNPGNSRGLDTSVGGAAQIQNLQSGVIGQNGILSKSVQGLPQPQNLPSTLSILQNRQNAQHPMGAGAYSFSKTYSEKSTTSNANALLGSGVSTPKSLPTPNPALSPPPPRGAQLQLYAPSLKAGNKALDIQDHGINAF